MTESQMTRKYCRELEAVGIRTTALVGCSMQPAGLPDRYVCHPEFGGIWLEMKAKNGILSKRQELWLRFSERCHVPCAVLRFYESEYVFYDSTGCELHRYGSEKHIRELSRLRAAFSLKMGSVC